MTKQDYETPLIFKMPPLTEEEKQFINLKNKLMDNARLTINQLARDCYVIKHP